MARLIDASAEVLTAANLALGLVCLICVAAVAVAVYRDLRERRRWHTMVPNGWPPEGRTNA